MFDDLTKEALDYHALPVPGKTAIAITKSTNTQRDLALAYSPGVAEPVRAIAADPTTVNLYTNKKNLVAVITDGTAVLGLGWSIGWRGTIPGYLTRGFESNSE